MKHKWVMVEEDAHHRAIRIFKSQKSAYNSGAVVWPMCYAVAVYHIRRAIWLRSEGQCEICSSVVSEDSGQMHEKVHRGHGGEISIDNSVFICWKCHKR